jgi:aminoglycoside phosphotransferase (APT) family kinase protein
VPEVLFFDADVPLLVLEAAPINWRDWRQVLLSESESELKADGFADLQTIEYSKNLGAKLGRLLAIWHSRTTNVESLPDSIKNGQRLQQLRTNPFHRATAAAIGDRVLAARLLYLAEELESTRKCLVYGDFSPKNFLVGNDGLWVIDAETAHIGDPILDLAFLNAHLTLKAMHKPQIRDAMRECQIGFMSAYTQSLTQWDWHDELQERLGFHTGAILASRVLGISRATYLREFTRAEVLSKATSLLIGSSTLTT